MNPRGFHLTTLKCVTISRAGLATRRVIGAAKATHRLSLRQGRISIG